MIQITPQMRIRLAVEPVELRRVVEMVGGHGPQLPAKSKPEMVLLMARMSFDFKARPPEGRTASGGCWMSNHAGSADGPQACK